MQHYTSRELLLIVSKHELSKLNKVKRGVVRSDFITASYFGDYFLTNYIFILQVFYPQFQFYIEIEKLNRL